MTSLHKLSDTNYTVADNSIDIRHHKVFDKAGDEIGSVDDLMVDDEEMKVRFLRVAAGGFLGIGETKFLVPVDAVSRVADKEVHLDRTRDQAAGAPVYDPDVAPERDYLSGVYGYWGYSPYWTPGYIYPAYPFYR